MADFVATIHVPAGQSVWPADEVPHLTADALYRFEPEPDPIVSKTELRRFTSGDPTNRTAGLPLSARELSQFARKCKAAGMSELPDGLPHRQWGEYLEAFNQDAEARGWWAGLIPPRDPHQAERLAWVIAAKEHRKLLKAAITGGEIQARMAGTLVPAPAGLIALDRLVLTLEGLEKFAALLAIQVAPAEGEQAAGSVPVAAEAPPVNTSPSKAHGWQDQAREEARRIRTQREAQGLFPGLQVLGEEVARLFRERGITGPNGHALTGAYIKRHALQRHGITADADRLKARLNTRGK